MDSGKNIKGKEVSLGQRLSDLDVVEHLLIECAEDWVEARAAGKMTVDIEDRLTRASHEYKKASHKFEETKKRILKKA